MVTYTLMAGCVGFLLGSVAAELGKNLPAIEDAEANNEWVEYTHVGKYVEPAHYLGRNIRHYLLNQNLWCGGLLATAYALLAALSPSLVHFCFISVFLLIVLILTVADLQYRLLLDSLTIPLIWLGLLFSLTGQSVTPTLAITGAAIGYLSLFTVSVISKKLRRGTVGLGEGDCKLLAAIGAWVGVAPLPYIVFAAALMAAIQLIWRRARAEIFLTENLKNGASPTAHLFTDAVAADANSTDSINAANYSTDHHANDRQCTEPYKSGLRQTEQLMTEHLAAGPRCAEPLSTGHTEAENLPTEPFKVESPKAEQSQNGRVSTVRSATGTYEDGNCSAGRHTNAHLNAAHADAGRHSNEQRFADHIRTGSLDAATDSTDPLATEPGSNDRVVTGHQCTADDCAGHERDEPATAATTEANIVAMENIGLAFGPALSIAATLLLFKDLL